MSEEMVTITVKELKRLRARDGELSRLEAAGVDNWEGYCTVEDEYEGEDEDEDDWMIDTQ